MSIPAIPFALMLLALLAPAAPPRAAQTTSTQPSSAAAPILKADYENNTVNSGIDGMVIEHGKAADAVTVASGIARTGRHSVCSRLAFAPDYMLKDTYRAESSTMKLPQSRYNSGDARRYQFSVYLPEDWETDNRDAIDIIWQFKRFSSKPDMFVAVKGVDIVLRTRDDRQDTLVRKYKPGQWIDFRLDIHWSNGPTGSVKVSVRSGADKEYAEAASFTGPNMRSDKHDDTYLKWGIYKPGFPASTIKKPRVLYHDDIEVLALTN